MAKQRNPSGLPAGRIVRPVYGERERDMYASVENRHEGFLRVRRTLFIVAVLVGSLAGIVALGGNTDSALGITYALLAPLVFFLACVHVLATLTRPKE